MNKKRIIGMIISLIGLFIMGYEAGRNSKSGETNMSLIFTGLFIVFVGVFIVSYFNKKKSTKG